MPEKRNSVPDGRREPIDRRVKKKLFVLKERRGQTIVRDADVLEIPIPALKGALDRRNGSRRKDS